MAAFLALVPAASAQIQMQVKLSRRTYILYESIVATVSITNLAGRDIEFRDEGGKQWFNVEITTLEGNILQPYDPDYKLQPTIVPAGQTVQRRIDLSPLFPIREQGTHRVRANVYFVEAGRYFNSNYATFDLTDGKVFWRQTVGVPGSGESRQISLLTHQLTDKMLLYARIRDEEGSTVYTTQSLGRLITTGRDPQELLDRDNNLHVLHEAQPGAYIYSQVSLDGQRMSQKVYVRAGPSRPYLTKSQNGSVDVRGGQVQVAAARGVGVEQGGKPPAKLSDRPAGLPLPKSD